MSPLEPLAPDQRAVVALVLQQGRSYDEIAALLGIPADAVRARARAGLAALAPGNGLPSEVTGPLADYLLGQQGDADAEATRGLLAESAPARAWAGEVAGVLGDVAPGALPPVPGPAALSADAAPPAGAAPAPRPRPAREPAPAVQDGAPPPSSRLGGLLLIASVVAVVAIVLFLVLRGGDDDPGNEQVASGTPAPAASATPSATAQPQVTDEIPLRATGGGKAKGTMTVYLQGEQLLFALQAQDMPRSGERDSYAIWLTGPGGKAQRLGFTEPVGADGQLGIQGPGERDLEAFPQLYATYENVVVSRERREDAQRPQDVVLSGKLPAGR